MSHMDVMRRVERAASVFAFIVQATLWYHTSPQLSVRQHLHQAALVTLQSSCLVLATTLPQASWLKYR